MSPTEKDRKIRSKNGNLFPGTLGLDPASFTTQIAAALRRAYGGRHSAVKIVANAVGANERAVRNWFEAKNGPSGEHLVRLMWHSDEMMDSVLAMAGKREFAVAMQVAKARSVLSKALAELDRAENEEL
jgi:hypothetical protein